MKVIVIGAGVVGMTSAWYLTALGHEVLVVERNSAPALETSFGNAGGVCPGFAGPWAAPGMPFKALKWMFAEAAPLKIRPGLDPAQWMWLARFVANCTSRRFAENKARMQAMAHYSKRSLVELREQTGITYDDMARGVLQVFATGDELEGGKRSAAVLAKLGIEHRLVDHAGLEQIEPSLARSRERLCGGLHLPGDETGDSKLFCERLKDLLEPLGCRFQFDTKVRGFDIAGGRIERLVTEAGPITGDAYVVACGPFAVDLLKTVGLTLPVYPVKGYSITCDITSDHDAPVSSVMDEHSKVMITRLGSRLRAAGVAELAGFDRTLRQSALKGLTDRVRQLFPGAANYESASAWCGFRPMTANGPAIVGRSSIDNLYLNAGHGSNGWTQACGTSRYLADIISGRKPDIDY